MCFVDTLDNMGWQQQRGDETERAKAKTTPRQSAFNLGGLSTENWMRVQEQNEKMISVIIGNPPYNANQQNENDNNKNRKYPEIDKRIKATYIAASNAQKTKQYDMYKRFIRWASDRLADDGIIAFVTNRSYLSAKQDDGFRKIVGDEFSNLYVLDLGSDVIKNPRISGTTHNVFGIKLGVAIGFFVRDSSRRRQCEIHYDRREDAELAKDKLSFLRSAEFGDISFDEITPDFKNYWLDQSDTDFYSLIPVANRQTKLAKSIDEENAVFGIYSLGVVTARDEWVFDFSANVVGERVKSLVDIYETVRSKHGGMEFDDADLGVEIKWTRDLKRQLRHNLTNTFARSNIRDALYRPFVSKSLYFSETLNEMQYRIPDLFPTAHKGENTLICLSGTSSSKPFHVLASNAVYSYDLLEKTQCLPLHRYNQDGKRVSNVTDWGLCQFREYYGDESISAEEIFAYTYAVLHDPKYREKYVVDLSREFPHLPFYADFRVWAKIGQELLDIHIGFEWVEPFPLYRRDAKAKPGKPRLRADKERGQIILDNQTTLEGVPKVAWEYRLGNRSALEWVLDQYKERKPKDPTIAERFNTYRFADYKEQVIDLLRRVCTVSVRTMELIDSMPSRSC